MVVLRLLVVLVVTVLLTGCLHRVKQQCAPPGAVQKKSDCYYSLELTGYNEQTSEAIAQVSKTVVDDNEAQVGTWFGWQFGGWFIRRLVGHSDTYQFFEYQFPVRVNAATLETLDNAALQKLVKAKQPLEFRSVEGKRPLVLGAPPEAQMSKAENPCLPPGQTAAQQCYYKLTITRIDPTTGVVKGIVPPSVMEENAKVFPNLAAKQYRSDEYTFRVRDLENLLKDSDYDFVSVPKADYLERCAKPHCEEYFPRQE